MRETNSRKNDHAGALLDSPPPDREATSPDSSTQSSDARELIALGPSGPTISIIVVSYNTATILRECLLSIRAAGGAMVLETIVVDNGSCDDSVALVQVEFPEVRLIANDRNRGFGFANNQGVAIARALFVLLLNSDAFLHPGTLDALLAPLCAEPRVGLVGPRLIGPDGQVQRSAFHFLRPAVLLLEQLGLGRYLPVGRPIHTPWGKASSVSVPWILGACLLARRDVLTALGPFDTDFFMYAEDIDLCHRIRQAGLDIRLVSRTAVFHLGGASARRERSRLALLSIASVYLYYRKHHGRAALALAVLIFRVIAAMKLARSLIRTLLRARGSLPERGGRIPDGHLWLQTLCLRPPHLPERRALRLAGGGDER